MSTDIAPAAPTVPMDWADDLVPIEDDEVEAMVEDFFRAGTCPATTHEEWLLRLCAQLMEREAAAVRVLEARGEAPFALPLQRGGGGRGGRGKGGRGGAWRGSSRCSAPPLVASTPTG
jgi:hypothetical protein